MSESLKFWLTILGVCALMFFVGHVVKESAQWSRECKDRGGYVMKTGYGKHREHFCISPDGRILDKRWW